MDGNGNGDLKKASDSGRYSWEGLGRFIFSLQNLSGGDMNPWMIDVTQGCIRRYINHLPVTFVNNDETRNIDKAFLGWYESSFSCTEGAPWCFSYISFLTMFFSCTGLPSFDSR